MRMRFHTAGKKKRGHEWTRRRRGNDGLSRVQTYRVGEFAVIMKLSLLSVVSCPLSVVLLAEVEGLLSKWRLVEPELKSSYP